MRSAPISLQYRDRGGIWEGPAVIIAVDAPLRHRYTKEAIGVFDDEERARFVDAGAVDAGDDEELSWELLYRLEPELYERLIAGERLHEGVIDWLPSRCERILEVGAGTGRLTLELAARAGYLIAVEPARPLLRRLRERLDGAGADNVETMRGFFDDLPAAPPFDMVISCSAFSAQTAGDRDRCLRAMEGACASGGTVVLVWPSDVGWLGEHGFSHVAFAGPMVVEYQSAAEAATLARIFYPDAAVAVTSMASRFVDFATLGINAPRDICWKSVA